MRLLIILIFFVVSVFTDAETSANDKYPSFDSKDPDILYFMGYSMYNGVYGYPKDKDKGYQLLKRAESFGSGKAIYTLSRYACNDGSKFNDCVYYQNKVKSVQENEILSIILFYKIVEAVSLKKEYEQNFEYLKEECEKGDGFACYVASALFFDDTSGMEKNLKLYYKYLQKAVKAGNTAAEHEFFSKIYGVSAEHTHKQSLFEILISAAKGGHVLAMTDLGRIYKFAGINGDSLSAFSAGSYFGSPEARTELALLILKNKKLGLLFKDTLSVASDNNCDPKIYSACRCAYGASAFLNKNTDEKTAEKVILDGLSNSGSIYEASQCVEALELIGYSRKKIESVLKITTEKPSKKLFCINLSTFARIGVAEGYGSSPFGRLADEYIDIIKLKIEDYNMDDYTNKIYMQGRKLGAMMSYSKDDEFAKTRGLLIESAVNYSCLNQTQ